MTARIQTKSFLFDDDNPSQTLDNCKSMLALIGHIGLSGPIELSDSGICGLYIVFDGITQALTDIDENYDFVEKSGGAK